MQYEDYSATRTPKPDATVVYCCEAGVENGYPEILRTYVYDKTSGTYTNRVAFTEEGYSDALFHYLLHYLP